jgi:hypothetical protein
MKNKNIFQFGKKTKPKEARKGEKSEILKKKETVKDWYEKKRKNSKEKN